MPRSTANLVMMTEPSAIAMPQDRSMPAVRMIRVWPMAMMPTTMTCCKIREKFWLLRKRSLCDAKKTQAASRAMTGPSLESGGRNVGMVERICYPYSRGEKGDAQATARRQGRSPCRTWPPAWIYLPQQEFRPNAVSRLAMPACCLSLIRVTPVST
ncbi:hypothetical protein D3C81_1426920 [compost metagenome]